MGNTQKQNNPKQTLERIYGEHIELNPYRSIVAIVSGKVNKKNYGSGLLMSKNLVLTPESKRQNTNIKVYHKPNGIAKFYHPVSSWRYLPQHKTDPRSLRFDYALMKLQNIQQLTIDNNEFPKLKVICQECFKDMKQPKIGIFGYPENPNTGKQASFPNNFVSLTQGGFRLFQYGSWFNNRVQKINHNQFLISYKINTSSGQSGCPIIVGENVIGINASTNKSSWFGIDENVGRLITVDMAQNIVKWSKQLGGDPIEVIYNKQCCSASEQDKRIQIKQQYMYQIVRRLQSISIEKKSRVISLTLKINVTILYK